MDWCPVAAVLCALILGASACIIVYMTTQARQQVVKTQLEIAKVEGHYAKQRREHLPPVVTAWFLLLLGAGGSCGLLRLDREGTHQEQLATSDKKPATRPEPTHKNCSGCAARCKCMNGKCDCPAQTEDELKKRADVVVPPDTDQAISAFGHPWATDKRL